jgi:hypothetical protein
MLDENLVQPPEDSSMDTVASPTISIQSDGQIDAAYVATKTAINPSNEMMRRRLASLDDHIDTVRGMNIHSAVRVEMLQTLFRYREEVIREYETYGRDDI